MKKEVKLGIFFIFTIIIFVAGVLIFGKIRLSKGAYYFYIDYNFSGDLRKNGKVRYRGGSIDIGYIEEITINELGYISVKVMMTDKDLRLPLDTVFTIQTVGFGIGEKYILANPPFEATPNMDYIREGDIIMGVNPVSLEETLGGFGDLTKDFDLGSITDVFADVQSTMAMINEIIATNQELVNSSVSNIEGTTEDLKRFSANLARHERRLERILENADATVLHARNVMQTLDNEKHRFPTIIRNMEVFSERLRRDPSALLFSKPEEGK